MSALKRKIDAGGANHADESPFMKKLSKNVSLFVKKKCTPGGSFSLMLVAKHLQNNFGMYRNYDPDPFAKLVRRVCINLGHNFLDDADEDMPGKKKTLKSKVNNMAELSEPDPMDLGSLMDNKVDTSISISNNPEKEIMLIKEIFPGKKKNKKVKKKKSKAQTTVENGSIANTSQCMFQAVHSTSKFSDLAGIDETLIKVSRHILFIKHPEIYQTLGVTPPRGILLHGPPGTGKTMLAMSIAGELSLPVFKVPATQLIDGISGNSERNLRDLFATAVESQPCIIFIDDIDVVCAKQENLREMHRRIMSQLISCLDDLRCHNVLFIGATSRIENVDPKMRRAGRLDHDIPLGMPNSSAREEILRVLCRNLKYENKLDYAEIALKTPGFTGADLELLIFEAVNSSVCRSFTINEAVEMSTAKRLDYHQCVLSMEKILPKEELEALCITYQDFMKALQAVKPSAKAEGFTCVPDTKWEDIGALTSLREELQLSMIAPIHHEEAFESLGLNRPIGILLCGPPGCGKTLLAKAISNESGINFISVKGPELLNMYVGESERAVREVFIRARISAPCIIFFDEIDALCPKRSGQNNHSTNIVNQLLTEMDGLVARKGIYLMAATNRPDIIDPAVLRPGRLDKVLYVGLPTCADRLEILAVTTKNGTKPLLSPDVDLNVVATRAVGRTGADLVSLVREASMSRLRKYLKSLETMCPVENVVDSDDFDFAFKNTQPSVSETNRSFYENIEKCVQT